MADDLWQIEAFGPEMAAAWDALVAKAPSGTLMQSRRFLDYHGSRFRELSLVGRRTQNGPLSLVFPLAADPSAPDRAVSHPGSSFGGPILSERDPAHARSALRLAAERLTAQGFTRLLLHLPPSAILRQPDDALLPDLLQLGEVEQLDLWSVLNLSDPGKARLYWQSEIRRAERKGVTAETVETPAQWAELHAILAERLSSRYGRGVVHSVAELVDLDSRLGPQSRGMLVRDDAGTALAGLWFLDYGNGTLHNQYNGATDHGLSLGASSYAISRALEQATLDGFERFSFGRSTNADGWTENRALLRFKARFGAGLASQFHIELPLDRLAALRD